MREREREREGEILAALLPFRGNTSNSLKSKLSAILKGRAILYGTQAEADGVSG